jgi:hypothetical protein
MDPRRRLLEFEVRSITAFLDGFDVSQRPQVGLGPSLQTLWIKRFPLPDPLRPDHLDMVMVVDRFPVDPPKGLFLLSGATHAALVASLKRRFNVFQAATFHGAPPPVPGYEWICFGYLNGWRYDVKSPNRGDNVAKMLSEFWRALEEQA